MLAATFIWGGIEVLRSPASHAEKAKPVLDAFGPADRPADETMVKLDAGVKIVAGSLLAIGKFPRLASLALGASLVPTTLASHRFWEEADPAARSEQRIHFLKNIGLVGGLLIAAADTEAKPSLGWRARRAARLASESANDVTSKVTGAASQTSHLAAGLAAGLAGAVSQGVHSSDLPDRAQALQKKAAKRAEELQEAAAERGAAWQKEAAKRRKELQKAATKKRTQLEKAAGKKRAELEKQAKKKAPEILDQASRFGHDLAARASIAGSEVAHQAEGVAKDARKRLAALSS